MTGEFERDAEQVRRYARRHGIEHPLLVAGLADKQQASRVFPAVDRVRAYPSLLFIDRRGAVFWHRDACLRSGISYCAPLKRYLWWQHIPQPPGHRDRGDTRFDGWFGIYEAPEPWGPWRTIYFTEQWDIGPGERAEFPPKWMSNDGRTLYLIFSGDDNFCIRKATLEVAFGDQQNWPNELPNLRYLGVGPDPDQIIRDIPGTRELLRLA